MKQIVLMVAMIATLFAEQGFAQNNTSKKQPAELLATYYSIKDALVSSNSTVVTAKAEEFINILKGVSANEISDSSRAALMKDAENLSKSKDIKKQREFFSDFSDDMYVLAKATKLSSEPIYKQYCPMAKANWLSKESAIKNPYYGNKMLTCGSVTETIK